ncbi:TonB-dependent siderophore receptor [Methylomonas sp. Kb3]|uniref:TonB-dependent siderophore receptor n=1 Tax=Methylomonas sp. Kb3 TaxID=1611544 RepID=UPI000C349982|nr:TonB-dependent receptor [Methylomonas sp. Kb3]PKD40998.1 TonB-dependent siderophore receptor [Methylomonas sp. Kb3]
MSSTQRPGTPGSQPSRLHLAIQGILLASALTLSGPVHAESINDHASIKRSYHIGGGSLSQALRQFATSSGLLFSAEATLTDGKTTSGLDGEYTVEEGFRKLLAGSGLTYSFTGEDSVAIKPVDSGSNAASTMPAVTVLGKAVYDSTDPFNKAYSIHDASTATKTDTPLMETPVNIQVIPKAVLNDKQVIQMSEAVKYVSGVVTSSGSGGLSDDIWLRGFRSSTYFRNGFRIDNQYSSIGTRQMANIERIEIMKGPASILYGRMEPGGMVNVVTKQPLATPYYSLQQQFGSWDLFRTTVDATGPINADKSLLCRFNASFESSGSYRELVNNERTFLAPVITWHLSPRTQATLELEYRHDNLNYDPMVWPYVNGQFINMPKSRNLMERSPNPVEEKLVGINWSHEFNDNWSVRHRFNANLMDRTDAAVLPNSFELTNDNTLDRIFYTGPQHQNTYYTTLDLSGNFDTYGLNHTLIVGGDYYRIDNSGAFLNSTSFPSVNIYNPVHTSSLAYDPATYSPYDNSTDYFGIYGQDQITLPFGVHIMGGLRYQYVKQKDNILNQGLTADDAVTPRVGVLWQPKDWLSLYGNYVENFGVSNAQSVSLKPLPPESAQQWEVGAKTEFFGGRLSATLAYFDLTKQNVATTDPTNPLFSVATGEVRSRGPEIDIRGEIMPGMNLIATYANLDTLVIKDNGGRQGMRPYAVPRNMGSLWATYDFQQGALEGLKLGGGVSLRDSSVDFTNVYSNAGYATVDLLAGYSWKVGRSKISAQLNINNLLDKEYLQDVSFTPAGPGTRVTIGTPRSFLGSLKLEF